MRHCPKHAALDTPRKISNVYPFHQDPNLQEVLIFFIAHLRVLHGAAYEGSLPLSCKRSLYSPSAVRKVQSQNYPVKHLIWLGVCRMALVARIGSEGGFDRQLAETVNFHRQSTNRHDYWPSVGDVLSTSCLSVNSEV